MLLRIITAFHLLLAIQTLHLPVMAQNTVATVSAKGPLLQMEIDISTEKTTTLIFPAPICKDCVDRGHPWFSAATVPGVTNVLKVKAENERLPQTNLTVFTTDGKVYHFSVSYSSAPRKTLYELSATDGSAAATFDANRMNDASIIRACEVVSACPAHRRQPVAKESGGMHMRVTNLYLKQGVLFFKLKVTNTTNMDYDFNFIRCYIRDRKQHRRTSNMELQIQPLYVHYEPAPTIAGNTTGYLVIALDKFTVADNKLFFFEVFEKNGDRVLQLKVKGHQMLNARSF